MKFFVVLASLASLALASKQNIPASEFTLTKSSKCSGAAIDKAIASGRYAAVNQAGASELGGGCGSGVIIMNQDSSNIHYYDSIIVDIVDDNVLLLGPKTYAEASEGNGDFKAYYQVAPPVPSN
jgi:hypothetical protein